MSDAATVETPAVWLWNPSLDSTLPDHGASALHVASELTPRSDYMRPRHVSEVMALPLDEYCESVRREAVQQMADASSALDPKAEARRLALPAGWHEPGQAPAPVSNANAPPLGLDIPLWKWRLDLFTAGEPAPQPMLLDPLFPLGKAGVLFGTGGVGKSLNAGLALCLAVAYRAVNPDALVVSGPFGGTIPKEAGGAALFITMEDDAADIHRRIASLDPNFTRAGLPVFVLPGAEIPGISTVLVSDERGKAVFTDLAQWGLQRLIEQVGKEAGRPVRLLVLDPASYFINGDDGQGFLAAPLMMRLNQIATITNCTVILLGHVPKGMDSLEMTMRGSGAWVYNGRFGFGLAPLKPREDSKIAARVGEKINRLVWGTLVKANHKGAPIGVRRLFLRDEATGRLLDITSRLNDEVDAEPVDTLALLVDAIRTADAGGHPFTQAGEGDGVHARRGELPAPLNTFGRNKLRDLVSEAIEAGQIEKRSTKHLGVLLN